MNITYPPRTHFEKGQGLIEYALLISLIAIVVLPVLKIVGTTVTNTLSASACQMGDSNLNCTCETYEAISAGPNYTCVGDTMYFNIVTTCGTDTNLSLKIGSGSEVGLTYSTSSKMYETILAGSGPLCTQLEAGSQPGILLVSRPKDYDVIRTFALDLVEDAGSTGGSTSGTGSTGGTSGPTNSPPVLAAIGDKTLNEGDTQTFILSATDSDGDALTFSAVGTITNVIIFDPGTQTLTLSPAFTDAGTYSVTITVEDGNGGTDTETFNVTVTDVFVNQPPLLTSIGNQTTDEGTNKTVNISATDPDGQSLTISAAGMVTGLMTFTDNGDDTATISITPNFTSAGTYPVTITVSDGNGGTDSETFDVVVNDFNQVPVLAAIGNKTVNELQTLNVAISATDSDGDTLTFTATGLNAAFMTFTDNGNGTATLALVPNNTHADNYTVPISVSDGKGGSDNETITITVVDVPDDGDSDGIPDATDNCPAAANANQADQDSDGVGNVCDKVYYVNFNGSSDITDGSGNVWKPGTTNGTATTFSGTPTNSTTAPLSVVTTMYRRNGDTFWSLNNLPSGSYTVKMYFLEHSSGTDSEFDIELEGSDLYSNYRPGSSSYCGSNKACEVTLNVTISDGTLNLKLDRTTGWYSLISAIAVIGN